MDVPRRGTLLRSGQYDKCAKCYSISSSEAKPWALCLTRMRVNAQEEKRKHGIKCNTSRPLEKGRAEGAGWICPAGAFFYVADNVLLAGIVSHAWHEILRLSPHLFRLGLFTHRVFSSAQDDDTRGRKDSHRIGRRDEEFIFPIAAFL